jgi:hypothetical protein
METENLDHLLGFVDHLNEEIRDLTVQLNYLQELRRQRTVKIYELLGSMSKAAKALGVSKTAVSHAIHKGGHRGD